MALEQKHKVRLGQILARLVPGFDGQVLAYKDYTIIWQDERPLPTEDEIIAEHDKLLAEETKKQESQKEKEQTQKGIKLIPPNADLSVVIDAINKLSLILMPPAEDSVKPSDAVKAFLYIDGKLSGKGK